LTPPPGPTNAKTNEVYSFNFIALGIPPSVTGVRFTYSFGVGKMGAGISEDIPVNNGEASLSASHIYECAFRLVADV